MSKQITQSELEKTPLKRVLIFLRPSLTSGLVVTFIALYQTLSTFLYTNTDFTLLDESATIFSSRLEQIKLLDSTSGILDVFFESSITSEIVYIASWATIGALVYFCIVLLGRGIKPFKDLMFINTFNKSHRNDFFRDTILKLSVRALVICMLVIYAIAMSYIIIPVAVGIIEIGSVGVPTATGFLQILQGFLLILASLHLVTILLRFLWLRARVFKGTEDFF